MHNSLFVILLIATVLFSHLHLNVAKKPLEDNIVRHNKINMDSQAHAHQAPSWGHLVGRHGNEAVEIIKQERPDVKVVTVPHVSILHSHS